MRRGPCVQDLLDANAITSNDVGAILATLGVEAARATVVAEVVKVRCAIAASLS